MKDCWVSPYGEVYWLDESGRWLHAKKAGEILNERYGTNYDINDTHIVWIHELMNKGWIRYSTCMNAGWLYNPYSITEDQKQKAFELSGEFLDKE